MNATQDGPPDRSEDPAVRPEQSGLQQGHGNGALQPSGSRGDEDRSVAAILGELTERDLDPAGEVAGADGVGGRDDSAELDERLHRLDEAHRRLRALLDQPDA